MKKVLLFALLGLFFASCSPKRFVTHDYYRYAKSHKTIAVLPFENYYTGRLPKGMTMEDVEGLQEAEAVLFQRSLYFQLLEESRMSRKKGIRISIQNIERTNTLLEEAGITLKDSWNMSPSKLAAALNVDAVVKVDLHKDFWLTDGESLAIDVATEVIGLAFPRLTGSNRLTRTSEMYINANLIDGQEGVSLWSWNRKIDTDWNCETDEAIARVNHQISRRFPYRDNM